MITNLFRGFMSTHKNMYAKKSIFLAALFLLNATQAFTDSSKQSIPEFDPAKGTTPFEQFLEYAQQHPEKNSYQLDGSSNFIEVKRDNNGTITHVNSEYYNMILDNLNGKN